MATKTSGNPRTDVARFVARSIDQQEDENAVPTYFQHISYGGNSLVAVIEHQDGSKWDVRVSRRATNDEARPGA